MGNRVNNVMEAVQNNLQDGVEYRNAYEVEKAACLVKEAYTVAAAITAKTGKALGGGPDCTNAGGIWQYGGARRELQATPR